MKHAHRTAFLLVSSVLAVAMPACAPAAEVSTVVQSIPEWNAGDGHLPPRTISVSQTIHKDPVFGMVSSHASSASRQVATNESAHTTRIK